MYIYIHMKSHLIYEIIYVYLLLVCFATHPFGIEDYEKLPAGTVEAHKVSEAGEERYILDAIIGEATWSGSGLGG